MQESHTARSHTSNASALTDATRDFLHSPLTTLINSNPSHITAISSHGNVTKVRRTSLFSSASTESLGQTVPTKRGSIHSKSSPQKSSMALLLSGSGIEDDPILTSLIIPCGERSDADLIPIIDFIRGLRFFQIFTQYPETFKQVAQRLELQTVMKGGHVFFEGQPGNEFYIVLDGEVSIVKKKRISAYSDFVSENMTLVKLSCGQTFGETALDSVDGLRTASAVATKRSSLLMLKREEYHEILHYFKDWLKQAVCNTLKSGTSLFKHLSNDVLDAIAARAVVRSFSIDAEILAEGIRVSSLMIIKSGIVRLVKSISSDQIDHAVTDATKKFKISPEKSTLTSRDSTAPSSPDKMDRNRASTHTPSLRLPSLSPQKSVSGSALRKSRESRKGQNVQDTPPGYWLLTDSQEYLAAAKPLRVVMKDLDGNNTITEIHRGSIRPPAEKKLDFTVAVLMRGQMLGEICLLSPDQLSTTAAYASTAVELYCIDNEVLCKYNIHEDPIVLAGLLEDFKFRHPPRDEVKKAFQSKYEWEIERKMILERIKDKDKL